MPLGAELEGWTKRVGDKLGGVSDTNRVGRQTRGRAYLLVNRLRALCWKVTLCGLIATLAAPNHEAAPLIFLAGMDAGTDWCVVEALVNNRVLKSVAPRSLPFSQLQLGHRFMFGCVF